MKEKACLLPQGWKLLPIADTLPSTNTWMKEHAQMLADQSVLIAREQTQGRGRNARHFYSQKDRGLYLSVLLKKDFSSLSYTKLTALCALALQKAIWESCQLKTQIKWVNDIVCQGHKLAGILCEALYEGTRLDAVVIGFGVNVFTQPFPAMDNQPGAIEDFAICPPSLSALSAALIRQLDDCLHHSEDARLMEEYKAYSCVLHQHILVKDGKRCYPAKAVDIDAQGGLCIRCPEGVRTLRSGEISIRVQKE